MPQYTIEDAAPAPQYTVEDAAPPQPGPLDRLSAWGERKFPRLAPSDMKNEEASGFGTGHPSVDRFAANAVTSGIKTLTSAPAAVAGWLKGPWTPAQSAAKMQERAAQGAPVAQMPKPSAELASDFASEKTGQLAAGAAMGEAASGIIGGTKALSHGTLEALSGTGPRVTKNLVKDTVAANAEDAANVAKENQSTAEKAEATRKTEMAKHSAETAKAEGKNAAVKEDLASKLAAQRKIAPAEQKLTNARSALRASVETAREKALKIGNEKYNTVNKALNLIAAQPEFYNYVVAKAGDELAGSKGAPTYLKAINQRIQSDAPIRYEDLQSDYSNLGKELSKGTLSGDVYHAYDVAHEAIGDEMQRIADAHGMGAHLTDARNYWRRMKQTFGKPLTFSDAATKAIGGVKDEAQENAVRLLGSFDPEIPKLYSHVSNIEKGVDSLPKPVPERALTRDAAAARTPPPKLDLTPRPDPKVATPATIGEQDVRGAKLKSLQKRGDLVQHKALWIAAGPPIYALVDLLKGNAVNPLEVAGVSAGVGGLSVAVGRALENPKVVNFLTQATERDVAQIPPELRGDFPSVVKAAQAKGIKVSPALLGAAAAPKKRVAAALAPQ